MHMQNMEKNLKTVMELTKVDKKYVVNECLSKFNSINLDLDALTENLRKKHPALFSRSVSQQSTEQNKANIQTTLTSHAKLIGNFKNTSEIESYLENAHATKVSIEEELKSFIDKENICISSRVKSPESIKKNIENENPFTLTDVVGFRLIPVSNEHFVNLLSDLETKLSKLLFKINILSYSKEEAIQNIGENSVHYKSIHYHIVEGNYMCEIQVRGKYTDIWSELCHIGLYKPQVDLTSKQSKALLDFGYITNTVDFFEFLNS